MGNVAEFLFNPKMFVAGIAKMGDAIKGAGSKIKEKFLKLIEKIKLAREEQKKTNKQSEQTIKQNKKQASAIALLTNVYGALFKGAGMALKAIGQAIPEIGQTFKVVGSIVSKNLLWPLRKELMPILQSVMNWARNNRANFAKIGQVLANLFRGVWSIFKMLVSTAKNFISTVLDTFIGKSKNAVDGFSKFVNMLVFKITTLATFINLLLDSFFDGFLSGLPELKTAFSGLIKNIKSLLSLVFGSGEGGEGNLSDFAYLIGEVLVKGLTLAVEAVALLVKGVEKLSKGLKDLVSQATAPNEQKVKEQRIKQIMQYQNVGWNEALELYKQEEEMKAKARERNKSVRVNDMILTPNGKLIQTNPMDTLVALKNPNGAMNKITGGNTISVSGINITVNTNSQNGSQLGSELASTIKISLERELRNTLSNQAVLAGGY